MSKNSLSVQDRKKALEGLKATARKKWGNDIIIDSSVIPKYDVISFGSYKLDYKARVGGIVRGRITQLIGDTGVGKSTLASLLMISAQKAYPDEIVGFIDVEQAFDIEYAQKLGLNTDPEVFLLIQPDSANQALDLYLKFIESAAFSLVVLDSIPALIPEQNLNADVGDQQVATLGRLLSNELRKIMVSSNKTNTAALIINQWRAGIGFNQPPKVMPGGAATKYYPSVTIDLKRQDLLKRGEDYYGMRVQANFIKNRFGNPYAKEEYELHYGIGIPLKAEIMEVAKSLGIVEQAGAWFTAPLANKESIRLQGFARVVDYYKESEIDFNYLETLVKNAMQETKQTVVEMVEEDIEEDE